MQSSMVEKKYTLSGLKGGKQTSDNNKITGRDTSKSEQSSGNQTTTNKSGSLYQVNLGINYVAELGT